jgi:hypothetical protein
MQTSPALPRKVLEGVPPIGYHIHLSPFPGSLYAVLQYIGDPQKYDTLMGLTGAAFRRVWNRDDGGNIDLSYFGDIPFDNVFRALGYTWHPVPFEKEAMLKAIRASLAKDIPVISFGMIGPPEAGIITGYENDGEVLLGWSYFQETRGKYFEKQNWFEGIDTHGPRALIVLGEKCAPRPTQRETWAQAIRWALDLESASVRPEIPDHVCGLAAYEAWASALEIDADYPADDPQVQETHAMVYGDQSTMVEERHHAASFLRQIAQGVPEAAASLNSAAGLYDRVGDLIQQVWPWQHTHHAGVMKLLVDRTTRCRLAGVVRQAHQLESEAVEYLKQALGDLNQ